jgi:pyruvate,water dikinase
MIPIIKTFSEISINDIAVVGGKNASLGEMFSNLRSQGINVPDGFAVTAEGYRIFLTENHLEERLADIFQRLDTKEFTNLVEVGKAARQLILQNEMPHQLEVAIKNAHYNLCGEDASVSVAVRSSATAEDLPSASFAGQLESFLNIQGEEALINAVHKCFTSLFTDRAIYYRHQNGFTDTDISVSVGVQKMVRSDLASSGVAFTLDPDTGFRNVIVINSIYGLGENIVQGQSTPDEFILFKPHIDTAFNSLINKKIGKKEWTMIYPADNGYCNKTVVNVATAEEKQTLSSLNDDEVKELGLWCLKIEKHYGKPMDIEWAKDGITGELFIVQARPETVQAKHKNEVFINNYVILKKGRKMAEGIALGEKINAGKARILRSANEADLLQQGEILVTDITTPDWDPIMKKAGAIITNKGGRTSHAAIVARELGTVAVVGCGNATDAITDGQEVTVSCAEGETGFIYDGKAEWTVTKENLSYLSMPATDPMLILGDPSQAFHLSFFPNKGVGLLRLEFLITHDIKVHPLALTRFDQLVDEKVKIEIVALTAGYPDKQAYFIERMAQGVATIAAAFFPKDVIVRMSDFKTNEYSNLLGGKQFEPAEENPMIGFRGASRYYSPMYKDGFALECAAMKKVREEMGLTNVKLMIPFCRTVEEGKKVLATMEEFGLKQNVNGLEVYMMVEIPSNVLLADEFAKVFDGFSIGSNDLTQLTLGLDRDSNLVRDLFSEKDAAVKQLITRAIKSARNNNIKIGLCGQAASDMPDFASFLIAEGINSISFNPDALLPGTANMLKAESELASKEKVRRPAELEA